MQCWMVPQVFVILGTVLLQLQVARHLLRRLTSKRARIFLGPVRGLNMVVKCCEDFQQEILLCWFHWASHARGLITSAWDRQGGRME